MKLYSNIIDIDEKTGLPNDYDSFFVGYRNLVRAAAIRVGIPVQDAEDALQEVQLKFWDKNGLDMYDPESGKKFASLCRSWTSLFMLQERDKVMKYNYRNSPQGILNQNEESAQVEDDTANSVDDKLAVQAWVKRATEALCEQPHLVPLLGMCVRAADRNTTITRADVVEATGCKLNKATKLLQELREALTKAGMGAQSIQEIHSV